MSYGKARAPLLLIDTPNTFSTYDPFNQPLNFTFHGLTLPLGGTWDTAEAGADAGDFFVNGTGWAGRQEVSDVSETAGKPALAGTGTLTNHLSQVDIRRGWSASGSNETIMQGLIARYTSLTGYLYGGVNITYGSGAWHYYLTVSLFDAPNATQTFWSQPMSSLLSPVDTWVRLNLYVDTSGRWALWAYLPSAVGGAPVLTGRSSVLATGGARASGRAGIYDAKTGANPSTRLYDNWWSAVPTVPAAINSAQSARFLHDRAVRENAAGTAEGRVPVFEGEHLRVPPATRASRTSRVVVKARRYDVDAGLPDVGTSDSLTGDLVVVPRVLLTS